MKQQRPGRGTSDRAFHIFVGARARRGRIRIQATGSLANQVEFRMWALGEPVVSHTSIVELA